MATTNRIEDYMGRNLLNDDPGTTDPAKDYLGRNTKSSNRDYLDRNLTSRPWVAATAFTAGTTVYLTTGDELVCTVAGTSHATTEPTAPGEVGDTVTDNTITWTQTELPPA